ncbi:MAG: CRISPR-associated endonuclease Cas2 [Treponema sp.]|nr:CRISPR-associated endonuclease Cas2 [Treponema sp.]
MEMIPHVNPDDLENIEGIAAKFYFQQFHLGLVHGYILLQSEVFMRITNNRKGAEKHLNRIKSYIPDTGTVRILRLTEKQFCNTGLYQAERDFQEEIVDVNDYISL